MRFGLCSCVFYCELFVVHGLVLTRRWTESGGPRQFEWNAADALEKSGNFKGKCARQVDAERQRCEPAWQWLRDRLGLNYMVDVAECTKRECVAWGQP